MYNVCVLSAGRVEGRASEQDTVKRYWTFSRVLVVANALARLTNPASPRDGRRCGVPHPAAPGDRLGPLWARFAAVLRPRSGRVCMHVVAHVPLRVYHRRFTVCPHMCRMKISLFDLPASTRRTHALPTIQSPPDRQPGQLLAIVSDSSSQISKIAIKSAKSNHEACSIF